MNPATAGCRGLELPRNPAESLSTKRWAPFQGASSARFPWAAISPPSSPCSNLRGCKRLNPCPPPSPNCNTSEELERLHCTCGKPGGEWGGVWPLPPSRPSRQEASRAAPRLAFGTRGRSSFSTSLGGSGGRASPALWPAALTVFRALQRCSAVGAGSSGPQPSLPASAGGKASQVNREAGRRPARRAILRSCGRASPGAGGDEAPEERGRRWRKALRPRWAQPSEQHQHHYQHQHQQRRESAGCALSSSRGTARRRRQLWRGT